MQILKNKKGALAQMITVIFLVTIALYLLSNYRTGVASPANNLIQTGNKQLLQMDKAINN